MLLSTTDFLEYNALAHRILRDSEPPRNVDAVCFFGQTQENDRVALKAIAERWKKFPCKILVGCCDPITKGLLPITKGLLIVRGSDAWKNDLIRLGVKEECVVLYNMSDKFPPSTDAEAWGMVKLIRKNSWKQLVVTVPPLHAVRAFVSLLSACKKNGLDNVCIWSAPSEAPLWDENVFHSGSMPTAPRTEQLNGEFAKISAYCAKGDHLTAREVLGYLQSRLYLATARCEYEGCPLRYNINLSHAHCVSCGKINGAADSTTAAVFLSSEIECACP